MEVANGHSKAGVQGQSKQITKKQLAKTICLIEKCYRLSCYPEENDTEEVESKGVGELIDLDQFMAVLEVARTLFQKWAVEKEKLASILREDVNDKVKLEKLSHALVEIRGAPHVDLGVISKCSRMVMTTFSNSTVKQLNVHMDLLEFIDRVIRYDHPTEGQLTSGEKYSIPAPKDEGKIWIISNYLTGCMSAN